MTSLDHEHLEVINRCDVETSSGLFVFKDRIVCVYWKTTHYDRSGKEIFTSLSEAALWWRYPCFLFECLEEHAIRGLSASTAISSRSRCFVRGSPSLKAHGDRMSVCRGTWDGFTPFSRALAGSWSPRVRFSSTHRRFFWTGRRDFISCFWGSGKCHLSALLSWWKSLRGGYLGNRSITSRLAAGARDLQTVKVRRQISVGWPGGGASATVSPLLRWSPWRGSSFMKKKQKKPVPCFCAVDLLDRGYVMMPQIEGIFGT